MNPLLSDVKGVIHGRTVELTEEPGLPDGQEVTVTLRPVDASATQLPPGEGLRRAFGSWADDAQQLDEFLAEIRRSRKRTRPEIEP